MPFEFWCYLSYFNRQLYVSPVLPYLVVKHCCNYLGKLSWSLPYQHTQKPRICRLHFNAICSLHSWLAKNDWFGFQFGFSFTKLTAASVFFRFGFCVHLSMPLTVWYGARNDVQGAANKTNPLPCFANIWTTNRNFYKKIYTTIYHCYLRISAELC